MPAAVINAVIAQRYETDVALVASAIVIGTLASLAAIPAVLLFRHSLRRSSSQSASARPASWLPGALQWLSLGR